MGLALVSVTLFELAKLLFFWSVNRLDKLNHGCCDKIARMPVRFGDVPILSSNSLVDYDKDVELAFVNEAVQLLRLCLLKNGTMKIPKQN